MRKVDAAVDFSFIHERVRSLYCLDNGRPALDPTLMFRALFSGYLFGIRSERQLVREIEVNVAYRWFLRLSLTDEVFDASILSQNRRRRFLAMAAGMVDGTVLYTDSTHLKANANKNRFERTTVSKSRADYWEALLDERERLTSTKSIKIIHSTTLKTKPRRNRWGSSAV